MNLSSWIVVGTIVGFLATWLVPRRLPGGAVTTVAGGMAGAFLGGAIFSLIADRGIAGFDLASFLVAFVGAVVLLTAIWIAVYDQPRGGISDGTPKAHPR